MTYPTEEEPQSFYSGQASSHQPLGRGAWQRNGACPRSQSDDDATAGAAGRWERPEDERFMMSGLMRRYNR